MTIHDLKCWPSQFELITSNQKRHEFRKDDRGYEVDDWLILREWQPNDEQFTGNVALVSVECITNAGEFDVPEGFCVMTIALVATYWADREVVSEDA